MSVKKIAVTGAGGFMGSRIVRYYQERYEVIPFTRREMDFTEYKQVLEQVEQVKPDLLIHCGAISDVGKCSREPEISWKINVEGTANIARACEEYGIRLIYCSSDQVYFEADGTLPHREDENLKPPHEYGRQKLVAEKECFRLHPDSIVLRLSWMYDLNARDGLEHGNLLTDIRKAVAEGTQLRHCVNDYRSITDVWEVIQNLEPVWKLPAGIYNFGSDNELNTYELVKYILKLLEAEEISVTKNEEAFAAKPRNLRMDISRIGKWGIFFNNTSKRLQDILVSYDR